MNMKRFAIFTSLAVLTLFVFGVYCECGAAAPAVQEPMPDYSKMSPMEIMKEIMKPGGIVDQMASSVKQNTPDSKQKAPSNPAEQAKITGPTISLRVKNFITQCPEPPSASTIVSAKLDDNDLAHRAINEFGEKLSSLGKEIDKENRIISDAVKAANKEDEARLSSASGYTSYMTNLNKNQKLIVEINQEKQKTFDRLNMIALENDVDLLSTGITLTEIYNRCEEQIDALPKKTWGDGDAVDYGPDYEVVRQLIRQRDMEFYSVWLPCVNRVRKRVESSLIYAARADELEKQYASLMGLTATAKAFQDSAQLEIAKGYLRVTGSATDGLKENDTVVLNMQLERARKELAEFKKLDVDWEKTQEERDKELEESRKKEEKEREEESRL